MNIFPQTDQKHPADFTREAIETRKREAVETRAYQIRRTYV